jgi:sulfate permease, SulP family
MTGMVALKSIVDNFKSKNKKLIFSGLNARIIKKLEKANFNLNEENLKSFSNIEDAINYTKLLVEK